MSPSQNPLLQDTLPIPFDRIKAEHVRPGVRAILEEADEAIERLAADGGAPTWENTVGRLDDITERVKRLTSPVSHLLAVAESPELREAFNDILPDMTEFWTRLTLNEGLWDRLKAFGETEECARLEGIEARHKENLFRDFRRAGADLPAEKKQRLRALKVELSTTQQKFSENVLDATNAYRLVVDDEVRLEGIPDVDREQARRKAQDAGEDGWTITLDYPSFEPVIKYAVDRELRRELWAAYVGRCRDGEFANGDNIHRILQLRAELATILGYEHFPDYRLEDHMAKDGRTAYEFVRELTARTRPYWERDWSELVSHGAELGLDPIEPWDVAFVAEDLRKSRYEINDELTRPYFPLDRVIEGLFTLAEQVFGLTVTRTELAEKWHQDVKYYDVADDDGTHLGSFYADWHPRPNKRQGAWMNDLATGGPRPDGFRPHVGIIAGNLTPTKGDRPSLLTHREVETIFHEFGHLLHHLTSRVPIAPMAGINVAWDFVELPSQIMENWTWEREALPLFSGHYETGEPLPEEIYQRMIAARRFLGGWRQMRQLSFGFMDLSLHLGYDADSDEDVLEHIAGLLQDYTPNERFRRLHNATSFTHLFAGGYAAAYYSYLWSEVLEADAFTRFREEGVFNRRVGRAYMDAILTRGDSADPEDLFREFMGRDPDLEPLLERNLGPTPAARVS